MFPSRRSFAATLLLTAGCNAAEPAPRATEAAPTAAATAPSADPLERADAARVRGAAGAPVWIVEVSDFQCPFCRQWQETTYPALEREYIESGKARLAYLNLPLPNHAQALPAAEAAMCAGVQGKFWPMHDAIFAAQRRWSGSAQAGAIFDSLAAATSVDLPAWRQCIEQRTTLALVRADYDRAVQAGVNSTPTFLIMADTGGSGPTPVSALVGAQPIEAFRRVIDPLLARRGTTSTP